MKRFHVHVAVDDVQQSREFYSQLFGQAPSVDKEDYAKWLLDDPRVNFAISNRGQAAGLNHLGFQAEDSDELAHLKTRAEAASGEAILDEGETACCYAVSEKHWTMDPSGIAWEHYHTMDEAQSFNGNTTDDKKGETIETGCCVPQAAETSAQSSCCG